MPEATSILEESTKDGHARIHLPTDVIIAATPNAVSGETVSVDAIPAVSAIFDMGPKTVENFDALIRAAGMVVWNGPLGYYENPIFAASTKAVAECIRAQTAAGTLFSIVGGGDTLDFHTRNGIDLRGYSFVSTGGGAMLEFISGTSLPAIAALQK
jgi:phosphoglycerate kinase